MCVWQDLSSVICVGDGLVVSTGWSISIGGADLEDGILIGSGGGGAAYDAPRFAILAITLSSASEASIKVRAKGFNLV